MCSARFPTSACQGQITLMVPSAIDVPTLCLHLKSRYTLCRILATRQHLQGCVLRRLEAPWVPVWGSRRHQFQMWWLQSVRTKSDAEERECTQTRWFLSFFSFFLSSSAERNLIFIWRSHLFCWKQKASPFIKSTCLWAPLWNGGSSFPVWNNRNDTFCFGFGLFSAEEAGGVKRRWMWCWCVAQVSFVEGQKVWDCIRADQSHAGIIRLRGCEVRWEEAENDSRDETRWHHGGCPHRSSGSAIWKDRHVPELRPEQLSNKVQEPNSERQANHHTHAHTQNQNFTNSQVSLWASMQVCVIRLTVGGRCRNPTQTHSAGPRGPGAQSFWLRGEPTTGRSSF